MKHLIVVAHPNPASLSNAYVEEMVKRTEAAGHEARVRNLYDLKFDAVLDGEDFVTFKQGEVPADIAEEQSHIRWADVISFVYPVWWTGMPAIMKGYFDRVFSYGFAFAVNEDGSYAKLLEGKKAMVFTNGGTPVEMYKAAGVIDAFKVTVDDGTLAFTGIEVLAQEYFGEVPSTTDEVRKGYIQAVGEAVDKAFATEPVQV